jgi:hypothetical protein
METIERYLLRKDEELKLLNGFLADPVKLRQPRSVEEVIEQKFHLAAALKAEHHLHDWALTETAWTQSGRPKSGPFEFSYDYQRADLEVRGPSFYAFEELANAATIYTASGMAAISTLLMALRPTFSEADIITLPNAYGETTELIEGHAKHLRRVEMAEPFADIRGRDGSRPRILSFDSSTSSKTFEALLKCARPLIDLIVFDTTCFSGGSGRICRVLNWARSATIPLVLLRSHTKLDSLGIEYGRLGSAVFPNSRGLSQHQKTFVQQLLTNTQDAIRLFGGAAVPAHFPPFVGNQVHRSLTSRRIAALLKNGRRTKSHFLTSVPGFAVELDFAHGLYVTLASTRLDSEKAAREIAAAMCSDLKKTGLPLRHAGSFGFDFGAAEWAQDRTRNRYVVRLAAADLPTLMWDDLVGAVAAWWTARERRT